MFTSDEMKAQFSDVMDRMVAARWLKNYTFTTGKGFHLGWTETGSIAALDLKIMAHDLELLDADARPMIAHILAQGIGLDGTCDAKVINAALRPFNEGGFFVGNVVYFHGVNLEWKWSEKGAQFARRLSELVGALGIEAGDEDRLLVMFHIAEGWAPGPDTKVVIS